MLLLFLIVNVAGNVNNNKISVRETGNQVTIQYVRTAKVLAQRKQQEMCIECKGVAEDERFVDSNAVAVTVAVIAFVIHLRERIYVNCMRRGRSREAKQS